LHICPNEHISGPKLLDLERSTHSHWFTLIFRHIWTHFDLLTKFLANLSSGMNFLYKVIDDSWWHVSHTVLHIGPKGHISGQRVLDLELFIHSYWLLLMLLQPYMSQCMTYWIYFWQISPRSLTLYTYSLTPDFISAMKKSILALYKHFFVQESSIMNFLYILFASILCYFSHTWAHVWPTVHISGKLFSDQEPSILTHWQLLMKLHL